VKGSFFFFFFLCFFGGVGLLGGGRGCGFSDFLFFFSPSTFESLPPFLFSAVFFSWHPLFCGGHFSASGNCVFWGFLQGPTGAVPFFLSFPSLNPFFSLTTQTYC